MEFGIGNAEAIRKEVKKMRKWEGERRKDKELIKLNS
jgi:hypothetical protein